MADASDRYGIALRALTAAIAELDGSPGSAATAVRAFRALPAVLGLHPQRLDSVLRFVAAALARSADPVLVRAALQAALQCAAADRLRAARQTAGLTLRDAAARVGLHFGSYGPLETGRTYPRGSALLAQIAAAYDLPPGWEGELAISVADRLAKLEPSLRRPALRRQATEVAASWAAAIDRRWGPIRPGPASPRRRQTERTGRPGRR